VPGLAERAHHFDTGRCIKGIDLEEENKIKHELEHLLIQYATLEVEMQEAHCKNGNC
jgi:hypothetical protein